MEGCGDVVLGAGGDAGVGKAASVSVVELEFALDKIGETYGAFRLVDPRGELQMRESLRRYGQMSPVVLCRAAQGGFELLDGFKRLRAARQLGHPAVLRGRVVELGARAAKAAVLCLNWVHRPVTDVEEAWVAHALCREDGLSQEEAGRLLGRDRSWVSRRLSLVERLSDEAQSQLRLGLVSGTVCRELARVPRGTQERLLAVITRDGLGSREVSALVNLCAEAGPEERDRILSSPRDALVRTGLAPGVRRDRRLSASGNRILLELNRMTWACTRVSSEIDTQPPCPWTERDRGVLVPDIIRAQRSGQQAVQLLNETLSARENAG